MKILVPVKRVAALEEDFEIAADGRDVDPDFLNWDLNEWDDYSLEAAVQVKEAAGDGAVEVIAVTVGPDDAEEVLRKCLAKGADRALRVWDDALEGGDPIAIARVLAAVARRENAALVLAGTQSADHGHASTGIALAALLDRPHAAVVAGLDCKPGTTMAVAQRELEGGLLQTIELPLPAVLTIQLGINTPRYASLRGIKQAASRPIETMSPQDLGLADAQLGAAGSLSRVRRMYVPEKGRAQMIEGSAADQAARLIQIIKEATGA
ncbi:MAG: electron transfer flavoprotein subunit beta/FixA family protein [Proteobacteria bacterium]|nr:electron transfer flavoprotein subunit beta/FixA family protein [Pseudomonadota bacterium]